MIEFHRIRLEVVQLGEISDRRRGPLRCCSQRKESPASKTGGHASRHWPCAKTGRYQYPVAMCII
eukprot:6166507-Pyramimonas_sp.AAC.1